MIKVRHVIVPRLRKAFRRFVFAALLTGTLVGNTLSITLDPLFANAGKFTTTFSPTGAPSSWATSVFVQPSGRIVIVGSHQQQGPDGRIGGIAIAGLTPGGVLDAAFGAGGKILTWSPITLNALTDAAMTSSGNTLVMSQVLQTSGTSRPSLVQYTVNGVLDAGFTADIETSPSTGPLKLALGAGGKIYVLLRRSTNNTYYLMRLNPDGTRDLAFGPNGLRNLNLNRLRSPRFAALHELPSGKFVLTGSFESAVSFQRELFAARFKSDLEFDRRFGLQGIVRLANPGGSYDAFTSLVQPDGKIVIGGAFTFLGSNALLVRLQNRGRLDTGFGTGGISMTSLNDLNSINDMELAPDGRIFAVGSCGDKAFPSNQRLFVADFSPVGTRNSFMVTNFIADREAAGAGAALQADGKILAAGFTVNPSDNFLQFAAARFVP